MRKMKNRIGQTINKLENSIVQQRERERESRKTFANVYVWPTKRDKLWSIILFFLEFPLKIV